jgi:hypothetical protein
MIIVRRRIRAIDWTTSLTMGIDIVKRLRAVNDNVKHAELSNVVADLSAEFADLGMKLVGVVEENAKLKAASQTLASGCSRVQGNEPAPNLCQHARTPITHHR